jgi:4-alpha-glucanotransferase
MTRRRETGALRSLAQACGIQLAYRDMNGRSKRPSSEALRATLQALGIEVFGSGDATRALGQLQKERQRQVVEPVIVVWDGRWTGLRLRLPRRLLKSLKAELTLESGDKRRYSWSDLSRYLYPGPSTEPGSYQTVRLPLRERLPRGYHRLTLAVGKTVASALVIVAPRHAFTPACRPGRWGLFCPLYALHSADSWGAGDVSDFLRLAEWNASLGGSVVATLPLLPAFFKEHFNPSPYSPVSRLFWNEFYIDLNSVPELAGCPEAAALLISGDDACELEGLRAAPLVDYGRQMALKRRVLELLAEYFFQQKDEARYQSYTDYLATRPDVNDYARFRAVSEDRQTPWREWPERLRDGGIDEADCRPELLRYYRYTQFIAHEQMADITARAREAGQNFYLDLPLGVHPDGYDAWRQQKIFAYGASVGAPPDPTFPTGQNWGFPPLHPIKLRQSGYSYVIEVLRHHLRFAGILRLDHVMGLHRLFWIPSGLTASDGVYVRYEAEEMYAILSLEAHRQQAVIVGEDLGLVPAAVRQAMRRHHIYRSYVAQYEMLTENDHCLDTVPPDAVAAANTHDMHPFAAFWPGADIPERQAVGVLHPEQAEAETKQRQAGKTSLIRCLRQRGLLGSDEPSPEQAYQAICRVLAGSDAEVLLLNIDDLLGATRAQNIPGTYSEHPNWQRRAARSLEQLKDDQEINAFLKEIDLRRKSTR